MFYQLMIRYGQFLFRYRNALFPVVLLTLLISFRPLPALGKYESDIWLNLAGILTVILGQITRAAVIGLAYIKRGGKNKTIFANTLVTNGIFAHCRNPLYLGNLLILAGFFIIHNNPMVYIIGGIFFLLSYRAIVVAEEAYLYGKFGKEYEDYCSAVNRWLPKFSGLPATVASMEFNWSRVLAKDYTTMMTWFTTVMFILTEEHVYQYGLGDSYQFIIRISCYVFLVMVFAFLVRTLKKHGRLAG